jgi:hypothetical protein
MEDFVDSLDQIIYIVSLNKRYMVYNASRRRHVHSSVMHMPAGSAPLDLITTDNLSVWTRTSRYRVNPDVALAPRAMTYREAVDESRDRYDLHQMMRSLLTPSVIGDLPRIARNSLTSRIDRVVEGYAKKHDSNASYVEPNPRAEFKGSWYYGDNALLPFALARKTYRDFGHLVARAKAGDESITNDDLRSTFFNLANRYSDASSHVDSWWFSFCRIFFWR